MAEVGNDPGDPRPLMYTGIVYAVVAKERHLVRIIWLYELVRCSGIGVYLAIILLA